MEDTNEMQRQEAEPVIAPISETSPAQAPATQTLADNPAVNPTQTDAPMASEPTVDQTTSEAVAPAPEPPHADQADMPEDEPTVDYTAFSREELVEALRQLLDTDDISTIKNRVGAIKICFNEADKEAKKAAFEQFIENGGNKDEYQPDDDPVAQQYRQVYALYRERRQKHLDEQEAAKQHNLQLKQQILEELRQLIDSDNESLKNAYDKFNAIQERWKNIGDVPRSEMNSLWQNYHFQVEQFFGKVKMNRELMLLDQKKNLESKTLLCEKAEELIVEPSIAKAAKELQNLRDSWREIGPVPMEQNDEIWTRFRTAAAQIDERRRQYYEQRHEEMEKNKLAKQALVDKAAELTAETPSSTKLWNDISAQLDELLKVWKSIGPVPREQNDLIWNQFKGSIDKFYTQKKQYFNSIKDEQTENYNKKIDLCLQAEAIAKREDWKKATDELLNLQEQWKHIGPVNRKVSEKIWHRFRSACDEFFAKKTAYYTNLRSSEKENLEKKEAILAQLKAHSFGDNKDENLDALKDFQRRWMEIGFVPIADKQRLQKDFRDTINAMFEKLKISAQEAEMNNFRESLQNDHSSRNLSDKREQLQEQIQKLRNDLNLWENNIGFLANSKQADLLKEEFEKKMQNARQEIALLQAKIKILDNESKEEEAKNADTTNGFKK